MQFLTDFADQALLLPLALLAWLWLFLAGARRAALVWLLAVGGVLGIMLVLKLALYACFAGHPLGLRSPSGHTAGATVVYGGFAALLLRRRLGAAQAVLACALPPAVAIALTRLALHMHNPAEVALGGAVGMAGAAVIAACAGPVPKLRIRNRLLALLAAALLLLLHGHQARAEPRIQWLTFHLWPFSACLQ